MAEDLFNPFNFGAKPFLKWAGGKTQLIGQIEKNLPIELQNQEFTYIEPFIGSGAVLFWMINKFPNLKKAVINDVNVDLINVYRVIAARPHELISVLEILQHEFHSLNDDVEKKREYYNTKRNLYNSRNQESVIHAALFIFLNRTCFNGLYRVNSKNLFNVPIGSYNKPMICDTSNIQSVHQTLQKVEILSGDYQNVAKHAEGLSFFYFDPPYKPLNDTSSFNSYAKDNFDDQEQIRLRNFCNDLSDMGHKWMLSNSDVKGSNPEDNFFDEIYHDYNIYRIKAKRNINSNAEKRGELTELLITNYSNEEIMQIA